VYVVDTESWTTVNASSLTDGRLSNGDNDEPMIASDGEYIVFRTNSTTLLPGPTRWLPAIRGNGNYNAASSNTTITVLRAPLLIRADDASKQVGAPLPSFTARASGFVNGDSMGSLNGTLVFATAASSQSPVGTYAIWSSGVTSANYDVAYANGTLKVVRGQAAVSVVTSPSPSGVNQPLTVTATVAAAAPAAGSPTGSVSFFDGPTRLGTATLTGSVAALTTAGLEPGTHMIEARYSGDVSFEFGAGSTAYVVNTASATPALSVAPASGTTAVATWSTSGLAHGRHTITATYLGDPTYRGSTKTFMQLVD
jgi:hypothetical protein